MHKLITPFAGFALAAALSGCNSTDALIPQVDVGGGTFASPPVTQSDLESMSSQQAVVSAPPAAVEQPVAFAREMPVMSEPARTALAMSDSDYRDPPGTLDAQASLLKRQPAAALEPREVESGFPAEDNQVESTIEAVEEAPAEKPPSPQKQAAVEEPEPAKSAALPVQAAGTIRFLPIIGAPVEAVTPLSKQLGTDARANGLTIKSASDQTSEHILKGYFSALNDGGKTTVVYVWDILDGAGNRLHRIQGQDTVERSAADLWSAVPPETMQHIAKKTIDAYMDWRRTKAG